MDRHETTSAPAGAIWPAESVLGALPPAGRGPSRPTAAPDGARSTGAAASRAPFLAADVGGTHARLALMAPGSGAGGPVVQAYRIFRCGEHASFAAIVRAFLDGLAMRPRELVLACTGCAHEGVLINESLPWRIEPAALAAELRLDQVHLINDFVALTHAAPYIDTARAPVLHTAARAASTPGPIVVVGPGTGLGAAVRLPGSPPVVLASEAGQMQLAARVGREQDVMRLLAGRDTHISYEAVLSGPGVLRVYEALCREQGKAPACAEPAAVTAAAIAGSDPRATETLDLFCGWLGSFAGDLAMLYQATGGIYLAGGFLSRIAGYVRASRFVERFLDKGVMRPFLDNVPVRVVDHGQLGVIGAASWYLDQPARQ
ncbi:glucokinase [Dyella sp. SG609]|uniref:glucokinase n=1 Tax=Dyella sp. SG609 TaxID=2587018 RepID=UPI001447A899|nr:glucokinase [Dyella sp. SG609]